MHTRCFPSDPGLQVSLMKQVRKPALICLRPHTQGGRNRTEPHVAMTMVCTPLHAASRFAKQFHRHHYLTQTHPTRPWWAPSAAHMLSALVL